MSESMAYVSPKSNLNNIPKELADMQNVKGHELNLQVAASLHLNSFDRKFFTEMIHASSIHG